MPDSSMSCSVLLAPCTRNGRPADSDAKDQRGNHLQTLASEWSTWKDLAQADLLMHELQGRLRSFKARQEPDKSSECITGTSKAALSEATPIHVFLLLDTLGRPRLRNLP